MVKDNNYVTIQAFMVNDLKLKGNELIVFAVIYGYTQDGQHWYYGTRGHLAEWCGATKGTVSNCLRALQEKGYIRRREIERHGYVEIQYQAVTEFDMTLSKSDTDPSKNCDTPLPKIDSINKKEIDTRDTANYKRAFTPPSIEEVKAYAQEKAISLDAESFYDYWESVGWVRGKTKMKDWRAAARQWSRNDRKWNKRERGSNDAELEDMLREFDAGFQEARNDLGGMGGERCPGQGMGGTAGV